MTPTTEQPKTKACLAPWAEIQGTRNLFAEKSVRQLVLPIRLEVFAEWGKLLYLENNSHHPNVHPTKSYLGVFHSFPCRLLWYSGKASKSEGRKGEKKGSEMGSML